MRLLVVITCVAVCLQLVASQQPAAPWFCHELDCPRFTIVKNLTEFGVELRRYEAGALILIQAPTLGSSGR
jgi:hypothetical protein